VPRKLGFTLVEEYPRAAAAPAESGTFRLWRMSRDSWRPPAAPERPPA